MRRPVITAVTLVALSAIAPGLGAAALRVPISSRVPATERVEARVVLTPVQVPEVPAGTKLRGTTGVPGLFGIDGLQAGQWMIEVTAPGYWHPPVVHKVDAGSNELPIVLWPAATILGRISVPAGQPAPKMLSVRFQSSPTVNVENRVPVTEIKCPVVDSNWSCEVPAGLLDLRLRATPFQTEFRWDVLTKPAERRDLGEIPLRAGSSLIGFAELGRDVAGKREAIQVVLNPRSHATGNADAPRAAMLTIGTRPNARGFFRIPSAPPGDYTVFAQLGKLKSAAINVRLIENREVELLDPLVVEKPRTVSFSISPPLDPEMKPWRVALLAVSASRGRTDLVTEESAGETGRWRRENVYDGLYRVIVKSGSGAQWLSQEIDTATSPSELPLIIPIRELRGTVKLAGEPLEATVIFGGATGSVRIPLKTNERGEFHGHVPKSDQVFARVTVQSALQSLTRTLLNVPFHENSDGVAQVDIALPATHVRGEVVGADGQPATHALVRIIGDVDEWEAEVEVDGSGRFEAFGHAVGGVTLQASGHLAESEAVRVQLEEGTTRDVRLTLRPVQLFKGRVVSARGPVAGARVVAVPRDSESLVVIPATTTAAGTFATMLQHGAREANISVEAYGYAFKLFHLVDTSKAIDIPLDQLGGTLTIECAQFDGTGQTPQPYLVHAGAERLLHTITGVVFERAARQGAVRLRLPMLERGVYSVCLATKAELPQLRAGTLANNRCNSGFVPPLGELFLEVPARD